MKSAVVTAFDAPLEIQERPVPQPGPGQVLVRMEACGLCHTDIHAAHGDWPVKPSPPFVPGHEGVGVVTALGEGVTDRELGHRVAIPWLGHACGHCDHCKRWALHGGARARARPETGVSEGGRTGTEPAPRTGKDLA